MVQSALIAFLITLVAAAVSLTPYPKPNAQYVEHVSFYVVEAGGKPPGKLKSHIEKRSENRRFAYCFKFFEEMQGAKCLGRTVEIRFAMSTMGGTVMKGASCDDDIVSWIKVGCGVAAKVLFDPAKPLIKLDPEDDPYKLTYRLKHNTCEVIRIVYSVNDGRMEESVQDRIDCEQTEDAEEVEEEEDEEAGQTEAGSSRYHDGRSEAGPSSYHQGESEAGPSSYHKGELETEPSSYHQGELETGPSSYHEGESKARPSSYHDPDPEAGPSGLHNTAAGPGTSRYQDQPEAGPSGEQNVHHHVDPGQVKEAEQKRTTFTSKPTPTATTRGGPPMFRLPFGK